MTETAALDFAAIGLAAAESDNLQIDKEFERELPKECVALLRILSYVELGRHQGSNTAYKPSLQAILTFELNHPKHLIEIDGKKVPQIKKLYLNKADGGKSIYKKVFNQINRALGGKHQGFLSMIGSALMGTIYHNKSEDGKKVYANFDVKGQFDFKAPVTLDPVSEVETKVAIAELSGTPTGFLWNNTTLNEEESGASIKAMWESIFIDGTRTDKDGKEVSKNWVQESIMENLEWEGSVTQALVQEHISLDAPEEDLPTEPAVEDLPVL